MRVVQPKRWDVVIPRIPERALQLMQKLYNAKQAQVAIAPGAGLKSVSGSCKTYRFVKELCLAASVTTLKISLKESLKESVKHLCRNHTRVRGYRRTAFQQRFFGGFHLTCLLNGMLIKIPEENQCSLIQPFVRKRACMNSVRFLKDVFDQL